jgi:hypothetical protein
MKPFNFSIHSFFLVFLLFPLCMTAQQPDWQWGIRGGSATVDQNGIPIRETVDDMAVDAQGNTYIVSRVGGGPGLQGPTLSGAGPLPFHGQHNHSRALLLASYDCQGNYRWSKLVSGYGPAAFYPRVAIDTLGHVYFSGSLSPSQKNIITNTEYLTHFGTDSIFPYSNSVNEYKKRMFLARYDTSGNFQQLIMPQSDSVDIIAAGHTFPHDLMVDPDGTQHLFIRAKNYTTYDGTLHLPVLEGDTLTEGLHILKYQPDGTYLGNIKLAISDTEAAMPFLARLAHDPVRDVYYLAGENRFHNNPNAALIIGGQTVVSQMFVAKFDAQGTMEWLREASPDLNFGLFCPVRPGLDPAGNIYLAARMQGFGQTPVTFLTFTAQNAIGPSTFPALIKMDPAGNVVWGTHGSSNNATPNCATAVNGQEIIFAGSHGGIKWGSEEYPVVPNSGYDVFLARFNKADGSFIAMDTIDSNFGAGEYVNALGADSRGNVYVGGEYESRLFVANDTLDKSGSKTNFFVAKYGKNPCNCTLPQSKFTHTVSAGGTVSFTYTGGSPFDRLEWSYGNGLEETLTTTTATHTYTDAGEYWVCLTVYDDSCGYDTWCMWIDPFLLGTPEPLARDLFSYYPNPAQTGFTLECSESLSYILFDLSGRRLQWGTASVGSTWISLEDAQNGIYLLQVTNSAGQRETVKIVKK